MLTLVEHPSRTKQGKNSHDHNQAQDKETNPQGTWV